MRRFRPEDFESPAHRAQIDAQLRGEPFHRVPLGDGVVRISESITVPLDAPKKRGKINARPKVVDGIKFPSETQARVYERVRMEVRDGQRLFLNAKMPLWNLEPHPNGKPRTLEIDFVIVEGLGNVVRAIDAKPKRKEAQSRDWARGRAAYEACYGRKIEETER